MYPHPIRLRGPWECHPLAAQIPSEPVPAYRRVQMPGRWKDAGLAGFVGQAKFVRRFGYPGQIDAFERVWLLLTDLVGHAEISVNGQPLGTALEGSFAYDLTSLLQPRNQLEILLHGEADNAGWGEALLEVRCSAYLAELCVRALSEGSKVVEGVIQGECPDPLELYVIADGRQAGYRLVRLAEEADRAFRFPVPAEAAQVQVDLVNVSAIWYRAVISDDRPDRDCPARG